MKVKELVEMLKRCDEEMEVCVVVESGRGFCGGGVEGVRVNEEGVVIGCDEEWNE